MSDKNYGWELFNTLYEKLKQNKTSFTEEMGAEIKKELEKMIEEYKSASTNNKPPTQD